MESVTVTGTSTRSTFIRISEPGRALSAAGPVSAGASAPLGAPVAGAVAGGGFTCTLFSGSSCAAALPAQKASPAQKATPSTHSHRPRQGRRAPRRLPPELSRRLGCVFMLKNT